MKIKDNETFGNFRKNLLVASHKGSCNIFTSYMDKVTHYIPEAFGSKGRVCVFFYHGQLVCVRVPHQYGKTISEIKKYIFEKRNFIQFINPKPYHHGITVDTDSIGDCLFINATDGTCMESHVGYCQNPSRTKVVPPKNSLSLKVSKTKISKTKLYLVDPKEIPNRIFSQEFYATQSPVNPALRYISLYVATGGPKRLMMIGMDRRDKRSDSIIKRLVANTLHTCDDYQAFYKELKSRGLYPMAFERFRGEVKPNHFLCDRFGKNGYLLADHYKLQFATEKVMNEAIRKIHV